MILDSNGKPYPTKPPRSTQLCPQCGAKGENKKPVLGGMLCCMSCGHMSKGKNNAIKSEEGINVSRR